MKNPKSQKIKNSKNQQKYNIAKQEKNLSEKIEPKKLNTPRIQKSPERKFSNRGINFYEIFQRFISLTGPTAL